MPSFKIDTNRFAIDTINDETIVMDLVDGRLFLFEGGASTLFEFLSQGASTETIEQTVHRRYGEHHARAFAEFSRSLVEKKIVVEVSSDFPEELTPVQLEWPENLGEIIVSEYDDMSSVITMDPIHDVDPAKGWPFQEDI